MKSLKAQVYVEKTTGVETLTVEFNCWEQLYESIRAVQYAHPTDTAGLDRFLDIIPQDFPLFEWQIPWNRRSVNLPKPKPLTTQRSDRFASSYGRWGSKQAWWNQIKPRIRLLLRVGWFNLADRFRMMNQWMESVF